MQVKTVRIEVEGVPAAQGSMIRFPNGGMTHAGKNLAPWRREVRDAAREAMGGSSPWLDVPVSLDLAFRLPQLKRATRAHPHKRPDLDKLVRAIGDALEGEVFTDDAQVVQIVASKAYVKDGERPGVSIVATTIAS